MNNTQFDIWFGKLQDDPDELKSLIGELLDKDILEWKDQRLSLSIDYDYTSDKVKELEKDIDDLEDEVYNLKIKNDELEEENESLRNKLEE